MERRTRRSSHHHTALTYFLEALRGREGVEALALSDEQGLIMGGAGQLDHEEIAALGASARGAKLSWNNRTLHVTRVKLADIWLVLTAAGKKIQSAAVVESLSRLLA